MGAADENALDWSFVSCAKTPEAEAASGSCSFIVPPDAGAGTYEVRLFAYGQFVRLATSNAITVTGDP